MPNTLFFCEVGGAGSNKGESNGQQIYDEFGSEVLPNKVDLVAEFGHVCSYMVSWSETNSESNQKGQSNESTDVPALEAKVNTTLQELPNVCQHQSSPGIKSNSPGHERTANTKNHFMQ
ncbi:hypothetical protein GOP47_0022201 [Adiantum capillus-veneris]|uniref:Uncharacterized protein n=1 Tax=Adiantum capillus-veneris TaxID=13818 RepID=A0A9D4Z6W3_ADICA|nr:hypothetical protein GOP47_0022201 [Adiantum capillus-veneris]